MSATDEIIKRFALAAAVGAALGWFLNSLNPASEAGGQNSNSPATGDEASRGNSDPPANDNPKKPQKRVEVVRIIERPRRKRTKPKANPDPSAN